MVIRSRLARSGSSRKEPSRLEKLTMSQRLKMNKPIEVWETPDGSWRWEVYRKYQKPEKEEGNPYARWFCKVISPFTKGDLGDVYIKDIKDFAVKKEIKPQVPEEITVGLTAGDSFESAKWELLHTKRGKDPMIVIEEAVEGFVEKGYIPEYLKSQVTEKAKSYMRDFIKKYGKPPK